MAQQLPYLIDEYFLCLQQAAHGQYKPLAMAIREKNPAATSYAKACRELDAFGFRAAQAMSNFRERKGSR